VRDGLVIECKRVSRESTMGKIKHHGKQGSKKYPVLTTKEEESGTLGGEIVAISAVLGEEKKLNYGRRNDLKGRGVSTRGESTCGRCGGGGWELILGGKLKRRPWKDLPHSKEKGEGLKKFLL